MESHADWTVRGPPLSELVAALPDFKPKSDCVVLLPVHDEAGLLCRHLELLAAQSDAYFDVVVVHSPGLDCGGLRKVYPFALAFIPLRMPLGPAALYVSEKYALELGYRTIIITDVDCLPESPALVRSLRDAVHSGRNSVFLPSLPALKGEKRRNWSINWYGAMDRTVLERGGLAYLPLFFGDTDFEFELRLNRLGFPTRYLEGVFVDHPLSKNLTPSAALQRMLYELRSSAPLMFSYPGAIWASHLYKFGSFSFFDDGRRFAQRIRAAAALFLDLMRLKMGRNPDFQAVSIAPYPEARLEDAIAHGRRRKAIIIEEHMGPEKAKLLAAELGKAGMQCRMISVKNPSSYLVLASEMVRSAVLADTLLLCMHWKRLFNPALTMCPSLYVHDGEKTWAVQVRAGAPLRLLRFGISAAAFSILTAAYMPLAFLAFLRLRGVFAGYGSESAAAGRMAPSRAVS